ncbi:MAG: GC-type dockerin domain-anchored protein [Planctomycetota bacterium]
MHARIALVAGALLGTAASIAWSQPTYRIIDLGEVTPEFGIVDATFASDAGPIGGIGFEPVEGKPVGLLWSDEGASVERPMLLRAGDNASEVQFVGNDGKLLGSSMEITFEQIGSITLIIIDAVAVEWDDEGEPSPIADRLSSPPAFDLTSAIARNATGRIVGHGEQENMTGGRDPKGWLLDVDGALVDLGDLERPWAITERGLVAGFRTSLQDRARAWRDGVVINLHDHPSITGVTSRAWDANAAGDIVGEAQFDISQPEYATMWRADGGGYEPIHLLEPLGFGRPQGNARSINDRGEIVGWYADLDTPPFDGIRAFCMPGGPGGPFFELNDLVPEAAAQGWGLLQRADHVNERGWIVGTGVRFGVLGNAFLLIPECPADVDRDGELTLFDFLEFGNLFDAGSVAADFDFDGRLTLFDFLAFGNAFDAGCD